MEIFYTKKFTKALKKMSEKERTAFFNRLEVFINDKNDRILNCHSLSGKYERYKSMNVKGDLRALFEEINGDIYFDYFGIHSNLYK